ncbi:MAG: efflux transporter, family, subunit [Mucilaginibacter sp.]|nr:efflux transporter, family, subunit [Mucilaginibacter sp.]
MTQYLDESKEKIEESDLPRRIEAEGRTPRSRAKVVFVLIAVLAAGIYLVLHSKGHKEVSASSGNESQAVIIHAGVAREGDIGIYIDALGTVTPISTVNIYSQVSGRVVAVHYREGQTVRKGDPLLEIDSRPYEAQLQQAEGLLDRDRGVLKQAEINLARYKEAFAEHAVAKQILDDQEQLVVQDQGTVKYDLGQVENAKVQLSYCYISSPISGRVGLRLVDSGNLVASATSSPLLVVTQLQPITVVFNMSEDHLGEVQSRLRQHTPLVVDAFDRAAQTKVATGALLTLDNQIDTSTGTVRFRGEFTNRDLALFPNQFVNARLLVHSLKGVVLVPSAAIQRNGTQAFVFVVNSNNTISIRNVAERSTDGNATAVEGLHAGERVALSSFDKLQNGTPVTIVQRTDGANGLSTGGGL